MRFHWFAKSSGRCSAVSRLLGPLGPSWTASPLRRLMQAVCFALFLAMFLYAAWPYRGGGVGPVDVGLFLKLDPLASIGAAIAARAWVASLWAVGAILVVSLFVPRMFCGYVCPMGTLIDLFDWGITSRVRWFRLGSPGAWRNLRYYVLAGVLVAAAGGVVLSGYVAAIPTMTRGLQFIASPLQLAATGRWDQALPPGVGQFLSIGLFAVVLLLGLLRPRFWCRHVCPSGAIFSLANLFRLTERKVAAHCTSCGKCARACSFDAVNDDFTTIGTNCAFCQTCGGLCPVGAVSFAGRIGGGAVAFAAALDAAEAEVAGPSISRRGLIIGAAMGAVGGGLAAAGVRVARAGPFQPMLRPPGSVAEARFVRLCVRCGECLRVCPSGVLQPAGLGHGIDRLWTPWANADRAGCQPTCNNCGQVCPTGAIAALSLDEKRQTPMGLAEVDASICLAHQGRTDCQTGDGTSLLCSEVCEAAGYAAIVAEGETGPVPSVRSDRCVGCGLCQARCFHANVSERKLLGASAIRVQPFSPSQATVAPQQRGPASLPASTQPQEIDVPYLPGD